MGEPEALKSSRTHTNGVVLRAPLLGGQPAEQMAPASQHSIFLWDSMSLSHWETGQIQGSGLPMVNCLPSGSPVQRLPSHRPSSGLQHPHVVGVAANVPWALFQWHQGITPALPPWPLHPISRSLLGVTPLLQGLRY